MNYTDGDCINMVECVWLTQGGVYANRAVCHHAVGVACPIVTSQYREN